MMHSLRNFGLFAVAMALMTATSGRASAGLITFTETVTGTGTLGSSNFTNARVILSGTGDTNNIMYSGQAPYLILNSATVTIDGGGAATATDKIALLSELNGTVDFIDVTQSFFIAAFTSNALVNYTLTTSIGPLSAGGGGNSGGSIATTLGGFRLTGYDTNESGTGFQATLSAAAVPEPPSLVLMGISGLAGLGYARRRRARVVA